MRSWVDTLSHLQHQAPNIRLHTIRPAGTSHMATRKRLSSCEFECREGRFFVVGWCHAR
ncbi:hypothetical protein KC19_10G083900 [Ceratodon purpureus]|uniref:Uncharacterized protein n=1 Tax=Ceratodon purpureus TaxID=3225 RepID=A0A8T0GKU1_CERPU|nr:hypothetical protein KC19_10G083900 [Ceratodon purpureus]